ncbi:MAG TPA: LemA family protein [Bacillota bacterium]
MKKFTGILIAVIVILLLAIPVWMYFNFYNSVTVLQNNAEAQLKQVDNQLQRRHDLIPNLVNTVKGYAKHETEIFTNIAAARSRLAQAGSVQEKAAANNQLEGALSRLLLVVENYPQLKANEQFNRLMDNLEGTENRLAVERKRYNELVKEYNTKIQLFPGRIFAGIMGVSKLEYFEVSETARENPEVKF